MTETQTAPQHRDETTTKDDKSQYDQSSQPQSGYDTSFLGMISQGQFDQTQTVDWAREYFDQADATLRTARRVAEVSALAQVEQRIVAKVTQLVRQQVIADIKRDPSLLQR